MHLDSDIYLIGLGMYELRQLTLESVEILRNVNTVYHLSDKHHDLCNYNNDVRDLSEMYLTLGRRVDVYARIAAHLINVAQKDKPVALAFDGNPMFYCDVSWEIAALGKKNGIRVEALPGVSCIDILPMQLGFEPGDVGMQIFEATQMTMYQISLNPYLSTLVLQIGYFGVTATLPPPPREVGAYLPLVEHLLKFYPARHPAIFIQSAYTAKLGNIIFSTEIGKIDEIRNCIKPGMTLYLPRVTVPAVSDEMRIRFEQPS